MPRRRRDYDIKVALQEIGWEFVFWIDLACDRDACEYGNEPLGSLQC